MPTEAPPLFRVPLLPFDATGKANPRFPRLLGPLTVGTMTLRNRIGVSPHWAGWWITDGLPNEDYAAYIEHRAAGGLGLFGLGATVPRHAGGPEWMQNTDDRIVPGYRMLADAAHRHGTKVIAQLLFIHDDLPRPAANAGAERIRVGMQSSLERPRRVHPWPPDRSAADLVALAADFGAAAGRAVAGGVDAVELHAHEGFLLAQFLSPLTNRRNDRYGGSLENRMRLITDTLRAMRDAAGGVPVGVRLKVTDDEDGGLDTDDYLEVVTRLEGEGLVDYLSLTGGDGGGHHGPMTRPEGEWLPRVGRIRAATALPVFHAGRITTPADAERAVAEGLCDLVFLTKAHIADPRLTQKIYEDRVGDARLCTRCLQKCIGDMESMSCVYNPVTSRERDWASVVPAPAPKRVLVIGGGPAGLEAAVIAAERGHRVTVWERADRIGGQVNLAASAPARAMLDRIRGFYQRQADAGRFALELGVEATSDAVRGFGADEVIVATGCREVAEPVPGAPETFRPTDALAGRLPAGTRHALIVDRRGGYRALLAADALSSRGVRVSFVTTEREPGWGMEGMTREDLLHRMAGRDVAWHRRRDLVRMEGADAVIRHRWDPAEERIAGVDAVIVSDRLAPENALALELIAAGVQAHVLGDANRPGDLFDATMGANLLARSL